MAPQVNYRNFKGVEDEAEKVEPFQPPVFHRPILATLDTFDQNTQTEYFREAFHTGERPLWNTPNIAVVNEKVGSIKSSASVQGVSPAQATPSGIFLSPTTNLTTFTVVPNMAQVVQASGPVQVSFALNVQTVNANDPVSFAIFRNGVQASQVFVASAGAANTTFSASGTYTDNPPLGYQVYDVRWLKGVSKVTAVGLQRTLQVLNLRAQ